MPPPVVPPVVPPAAAVADTRGTHGPGSRSGGAARRRRPQAKDKELDSIKAACTRDEGKLKDAEAALAKELAQKAERERMLAERAEQERRDQAASRIQRSWRRYWEAKLAERAKSAEKKKKGGKGKGKK